MKILYVVIGSLLTFVIFFLVSSKLFGTENVVEADYSQVVSKYNSPLVVFTIEGCPFCHKAKEFLTEHELDFVEVDLGLPENSEYFLNHIGGDSVPVLITSNKQIVGFDSQTYKEHLASTELTYVTN